MKHDVTLFFKSNREFSNFYNSPFEIYGEVYPTVEHYFMTRKAQMFDPDGEAIKKMNNECTPAQMKKLGRQVKNFDPEGWDDESRGIMFYGVYEKFSQNLELREKLLQTGYDILAEASPYDRKWGIGIGESHESAYQPDKWEGRNQLGEILMLVRGIFRYSDYDWKSVLENIPDLCEEGCPSINCFDDLVNNTPSNIKYFRQFSYRYSQFHNTTSDVNYDAWIERICKDKEIKNYKDFRYILNLSFEMLTTMQAGPSHNIIFNLVHSIYKNNDFWDKIYVGDPET